MCAKIRQDVDKVLTFHKIFLSLYSVAFRGIIRIGHGNNHLNISICNAYYGGKIIVLFKV